MPGAMPVPRKFSKDSSKPYSFTRTATMQYPVLRGLPRLPPRPDRGCGGTRKCGDGGSLEGGSARRPISAGLRPCSADPAPPIGSGLKSPQDLLKRGLYREIHTVRKHVSVLRRRPRPPVCPREVLRPTPLRRGGDAPLPTSGPAAPPTPPTTLDYPPAVLQRYL